MIIFRILSVISALLALAAGAVDVTRVVTPEWLAATAPALYQLPSTIPAVALGILTLIFVVIYRGLTKGHGRPRRTTGPIMGALLAILLAVVSLALSSVFPDGIINTKGKNSSTLSASAATAKKQIESASGTCSSGWTSLSTSNYPGVDSVVVCASSMMAYASFDNSAAANMYRAPLQSQAIETIQSQLSDSQIANLPAFSSLSGNQQIVVGPTSTINKLQKQLGGVKAKVDMND
ncbi:MAG: hypothetical protein LKJ47_02615 [Bifidobacteriaceae bacterium]|jgi:hypothetical protein|nr:hypothetical protein [Bifidobacteriaceae bacterium]